MTAIKAFRITLLGAVSAVGFAPAAAAQVTAPGTVPPAQASGAAPTTLDTTDPQSNPAGPPAPMPPLNGPGAAAAAQGESATGADEIVVTGIRASQQRAVALKRNATSVSDSISAEDIGKLPDTTISDSLQRIPGVEIRRDAGEGSSINIRGLPQVTTLLNGEQYLGANSINSVQPNFNDIPSQLFSGADVIKSSTADLIDAGITGTVNLRTRRPFDLKRGLTVAVDGEGVYGDKTKDKDPSVNGLISWHNDKVGFLVSGAYSDEHLSNSQVGILSNYGATIHDEGADATSTNGFSPANRPHGTAVAGGIDVNGDGDASDAFIVPQGFEAFNTVTQRQRLGINGSFQWKINDNLELTADGFFTHQTQYNLTSGVQQQDINWQAAEFVPGASHDTGQMITGPDGGSYHLNTVQSYNYDLGDFSSYAQTDKYVSQSQDYNLQLKWNDGDRLTVTLRGIYGKAYQNYDQSYAQFSPSNGQQWEAGGIGRYPASLGGNKPFNPNGYTVDTLAGPNSLHSIVNFSGDQPNFTLPSQLVSELSNPNDYALKTLSSEGNYRQRGDIWVARLDAGYKVSDDLNFEVGARYSERTNENFAFDRAAPLYAGEASQPGGCLVKWKGFDVPINDASCHAGSNTFDPANPSSFLGYTAGYTRPASDPTMSGLVTQVKPPVAGIPAVYVVNPAAMKNAEAFQNSFYPGNVEVMNPGSSYQVGLKQLAGYFQINGHSDFFGIPVTANGGLKVIDTKLDILQYVTGNPQPYGLAGLVAGTVNTNRDFTDFLPSFNLAFDFTNRVKLRLAMTRTMTLLNLDQWGGGLTPTYAIDTSGPVPVFRVTGGNSSGNPQLDPWRATNFDASLEWYVGRASIISVAGFYIKVDSFIQSGSVVRTDLPDNDGVVRGRSVAISTPIQGSGGVLKGVEAQWQQSFGDLHFMPHFLRNFGLDANLTYSPSDSGQKDLAGGIIPFQDNSEIQTNLVGYYQDNHFQARIAWNYRSKRAVSSDFGGISGLELYQAPTNYVDASLSYDINSHFTIYGQGSNLTGEYERYYLTWADEHAYNNLYERRYTIGARVKF